MVKQECDIIDVTDDPDGFVAREIMNRINNWIYRRNQELSGFRVISTMLSSSGKGIIGVYEYDDTP